MLQTTYKPPKVYILLKNMMGLIPWPEFELGLKRWVAERNLYIIPATYFDKLQ